MFDFPLPFGPVIRFSCASGNTISFKDRYPEIASLCNTTDTAGWDWTADSDELTNLQFRKSF